MDYQEEQRNELEALESIYSNELEVLRREPPLCFSIEVKTDPVEPSMIGDDTVGMDRLFVLFKFTLPEKYPDDVPRIEIEESENLEDDKLQELNEFMLEQAEANKGLVMIFSLVSSAQEWLNEKSDQIHAEKKDAKRRADEEVEKEEMKRFEGTRVTVESFMAWRKKFEEEFLKKTKKVVDTSNKRLTGRELFERDKSLFESDLTLMDDGDADFEIDERAASGVQVDESLFQELEDLDLDELEASDESDDPDFKPEKSSKKNLKQDNRKSKQKS